MAALIAVWVALQRRIGGKLRKRIRELDTKIHNLLPQLGDVRNKQTNLKEQVSNLEKQLKESLIGPRSLSATLPEVQFGFRIRRIRKFVEIGMDGSSNGTVEREGIKATSQTILHFPHSYGSSIPDARADEPELLRGEVPHKLVQMKGIKKTNGQCRFFITVQGGLSPTDGELSYAFAYTVSKSFYMTQEEMKSAGVQYEYSTYLITSPTKFLELEVQFPPKYSVKCFLGCYVGDTEFVNDLELQRRNKEKCFAPLARGARVQIKKPLIGFRYGTYWIPMRSQKYEELRGT